MWVSGSNYFVSHLSYAHVFFDIPLVLPRTCHFLLRHAKYLTELMVMRSDIGVISATVASSVPQKSSPLRRKAANVYRFFSSATGERFSICNAGDSVS